MGLDFDAWDKEIGDTPPPPVAAAPAAGGLDFDAWDKEIGAAPAAAPSTGGLDFDAWEADLQSVNTNRAINEGDAYRAPEQGMAFLPITGFVGGGKDDVGEDGSLKPTLRRLGGAVAEEAKEGVKDIVPGLRSGKVIDETTFKNAADTELVDYYQRGASLNSQRVDELQAAGVPYAEAIRQAGVEGAQQSQAGFKKAETALEGAFPADPSYAGKSSGDLENVVRGVSRSLPGMVVTGVSPSVGMGILYEQMAGQSFAENEAKGADPYRNAVASNISAAIQAPLESAGDLLALGAVKRAFKGNALAAKAADLFKVGGGEALENVLQGFPEDIANYWTSNPEATLNDAAKAVGRDPELMARVWERTWQGAAGGLLLAGVGQTAGGVYDASRRMLKKPDAQTATPPAAPALPKDPATVGFWNRVNGTLSAAPERQMTSDELEMESTSNPAVSAFVKTYNDLVSGGHIDLAGKLSITDLGRDGDLSMVLKQDGLSPDEKNILLAMAAQNGLSNNVEGAAGRLTFVGEGATFAPVVSTTSPTNLLNSSTPTPAPQPDAASGLRSGDPSRLNATVAPTTSLADRIIQAESGGNPNAQAGTSSARGLGQFTEGTRNAIMQRHGVDAWSKDPAEQRRATEILIEENRQSLRQSLGREPNDGEIYMAQFLGAGGAKQFLPALSQAPNDAAINHVSAGAAAANKSIFYSKDGQPRTVQQVYDLMAAKVGGGQTVSASPAATTAPAAQPAQAALAGVPQAPQTIDLLTEAAPIITPAQAASDPVAAVIDDIYAPQGAGVAPNLYEQPPAPIVAPQPEPQAYIDAQVQAMADPRSSKRAVLITPGSPLPTNLPQGTQAFLTQHGTVLTSDPQLVRTLPYEATDQQMGAAVLNWEGGRPPTVSGGKVVRALDANGVPVGEVHVLSKDVPKAMEAMRALSPVGKAVKVSLNTALTDRQQMLAQEQQAPQDAPEIGAPDAWAGHSFEDLQKALGKAVAGATIAETPDGHRIDMPNGSTLHVNRTGAITIDRAAARAGGYTDEEIDRANAAKGSFRMINGKGVIQLTEAGKGELGHELMHFARVAALTAKQNAILDRAYMKDAVEIAEKLGRPQDVKDILEEVIARAYNEWLAKRGADRSGMFAIIRRFFRGIRQSIKPAEGVFEKVASGEAWTQETDSVGERGDQYALAYHGSPHRGIEQFNWEKHKGTGEGNAAFGAGTYVTQTRSLGEQYRQDLSKNKASEEAWPALRSVLNEVDDLGFDSAGQAAGALLKGDWKGRYDLTAEEESRVEAALDAYKKARTGQLYEVDVPDTHELMDWDKPLSEQPAGVREKLQAALGDEYLGSDTGERLYKQLASGFLAERMGIERSPQAASQYLRSIGIPGHRYLDGMSRDKGDGSHNFVIYDDSRAKITKTFYSLDANGPSVKDDVALPPVRYSIHTMPEWRLKTTSWMKANGFSANEIRDRLAAIDGQFKIFDALGPYEVEMYPVGAGENKPSKSKGTGGPFRTNADPIYKITFDASAMCVKRLSASATASYVQSKIGRALSTSERMALVSLYKAEGKTAPCLYCYVEAPRAKMATFTQKGIDVALGIAPVPKGWKGKTAVAAQEGREEAKRLGLTATDLDPNLFTDVDYLQAHLEEAEALLAKAPKVFNLIKQAGLAAKANLPKRYEEYNSHIMNIPDEVIGELNSYAGLRFFSSSDFQAEHVVDLMQAFQDMDLRKIRAHSYTKVPNFVEVFGRTGMKINTSIFAKEHADGTFTQDTFQGMEWEDAKRYRQQYPDVGTIMVSTSDKMTKWALGQDWIDYVIPFHYSGLEGKFYKELGWQDFTATQSEKSIPKLPKGEKPNKIRMHDVGTAEGLANTDATRAYLELAMERKLYPVFPAFLFKDTAPAADAKARTAQTRQSRQRWAKMVNEGQIDWSQIDPNYFKLKKDYARSDTPFNPVKAEFNMEKVGEITKSFTEGNEPKAVVDQGIADKLVSMIKEADGTGRDIGVEMLRKDRGSKADLERYSLDLTEEEQAELHASVPRYSIRTKPDPVKTVKAYKLFRVDPKKPGKLFPLFVDANTPVPVGPWLDAEAGEMNAKGKVKSKLGPLAYRPGWHAGDSAIATHIGGFTEEQKAARAAVEARRDEAVTAKGITKEQANKLIPYPDHAQKPSLRPDNQVWAEIEMAADQDWQEEANSRGINKKGKLVHKHAHITDQIPVDGFYKYKTNSNMTGSWMIGGAIKVNRILSDAEVKATNDAAGVKDLPRIEPFDAKKYGFDSEDGVQYSLADTAGAPANKAEEAQRLWAEMGTESPYFKKWFGDSKVVDESGKPLAVYHGTNDRFTKISLKKGSQGLFWFASNRSEIESGESGAQGTKRIMELYAQIKKPAGWNEYDKYSTDELRGMGYDGVILPEKDGSFVGFVFNEPGQIKSATGNRGTFDSKNPDIRYSLNTANPLLTQDGLPSETLIEFVVRKMQDRMNRLTKTVKVLGERNGAPLADDKNAALLENLYQGRTEEALRQVEADHIKPLIEAIKTADVTVADVEDALYAMHAKRRNMVISGRTKGQNVSGSGITDAEADQIMDDLRNSGKLAKLYPIIRRVWNINKARLALLKSSGLESADTLDLWYQTYGENYVPLKTGADIQSGLLAMLRGAETTRGMGTGRGYDIRGRESRHATGRHTKAGNILANILADYETTIIRAEKNRVGQAFLRMAEDNPDAKMWEIDKTPTKPFFNVKTGEVEVKKDPRYKLADNVLSVKVDGQERLITIKDDVLARAMKNLGAESGNMILKMFAGYNRAMSLINTSLDPEFMVSNFLRDIQTAGFNLTAEDKTALAAKILKDTATGKPIRGIYRALREKNSAANDEWSQWFDRYRKAGGKIGFFGLRSVEDQANRIEGMLSEANGGAWANTKSGTRAVLDYIGDANGAVENGMRLAVFRRSVEAGLSEEQAASIAKELTVNFNKRGEISTVLNALYLFANASVQGNARILKALTTSKRGLILSGAIVASSVALAALNRQIGGDDDKDGQSWYDKIDESTKARNLVLMKWWKNDGTAMTLPLPYGYNTLKVIGDQIEAMAAGKKTPLQATGKIVSAFVDAFNPLGSSGTVVGTFLPTISRPFVDLATNTDFGGNPIKPTQSKFGPSKPESQLAWSNISKPAKWVAEELNKLTGGDEFEPGKIDVSPEVIEHLWSSYTGGVARFANRVVNLGMNAYQGTAPATKDIPFLRRLMTEPSPYVTPKQFREMSDTVLRKQTAYMAYHETDPERAKAYRQDNLEDLAMVPKLTEANKAIKPLAAKRNEIKAMDISDAEKALRFKPIDEKMADIQKAFIKDYMDKGATPQEIQKADKTFTLKEANKMRAEILGDYSEAIEEGNTEKAAEIAATARKEYNDKVRAGHLPVQLIKGSTLRSIRHTIKHGPSKSARKVERFLNTYDEEDNDE